MKIFPISINSHGKKVLILGGGKSSLIKTKTFLMGEFTIDIISPSFLDEFYKLYDENKERISLIIKEVSLDFNDFSCDYLVLATGDKNLNTSLRKKAKSLKIPTLDTSSKVDSDFYLNKICTKDDLTFSISTGGKAPSLGKYLAEDFYKYIEEKDYEKIGLLVELREQLKKRGSKNIKELMNKAIDLEKSQIRNYIEGLYEDKDRN